MLGGTAKGVAGSSGGGILRGLGLGHLDLVEHTVLKPDPEGWIRSDRGKSSGWVVQI